MTANAELEDYRLRAREWLGANMTPVGAAVVSPAGAEVEAAQVARARRLQRKLHDGGFSGITFPVEYGGQGLSTQHQRIFTDESVPYEMPLLFNVPTLGILAATLLDFGTEEQKCRHLPAILKGEELWVQFLSEPAGGSDLAGCITRATRDGDVYILNGSKIWTSGAYRSDYAMCLARTDWDVPKHRGLTMFVVKIHQRGIQIDRIRQVNGSMEFCQEFFDDVTIPAEDVVGEVNDGWTVASRLLFHERASVGGASPYTSGEGEVGGGGRLPDMRWLAQHAGRNGDPHVRQLVAESHVLDVVHRQFVDRLAMGMRTGYFPGPAGALVRLYAGEMAVRRSDISMEIAGSGAVASGADDVTFLYGEWFLGRQASCLGGGSTEIARNIISERVLGMPREHAADRDVPFSQVKGNELSSRR